MVSTESRSPLAWAGFLAASWTWVIGMFLPVLLVRDFGGWAWVIFAVPNCLGAAAMGWVMRSPGHSRQFVIEHASALRLFSLVTIAFHLFVVSWLLPIKVGPWGYVASAVLVQAAFTPVLSTRASLISSAIVLLASVGLGLGLAGRGALEMPAFTPFATGDVIGLSLVCTLGFLCCPYLDLTFHRARQATDGLSAKVAFGLGFCVLFLAMIVLTLLYTPTFFRMIGPSAVLLAIHIGLQATLTVNLHAASLARQAEARDDRGNTRAALGAALAVGLAGAFVANFAAASDITYRGMPIGEMVYRSFMSFYGLVAPAYLMIALFGAGRRVGPVAWLTIIVLAGPFYWIGFMEKQMAWTTAGVAIVIIGAFVASRMRGATAAVSADV